MNNYTTITRYKAATPRSARRQKGYTVPTISLPSGNSVSLGGVVMLSGEQTITSIKDFLAGIKIGGISVYSSKPDTIFVDANLVVRGAVTMYGDDGTTLPSIFDVLPIDNETIKRNANGQLYAVGGSSGSGLDLVQLEEYLTTNGYATQSWVTGKGYITSSALEPYALKTAIPTNTNQLTNGAGFITGISSSMVTNALGYTPVAVNIGLTSADNNAIGYGYFDGGWPEAGPAMVFGAGNYKAGVHVGALGSAIRYGYTAGATSFTWRTILDDNNYSNYALPLTGGTVDGSLHIGGSLYPTNIKYYGSGKVIWHNDENHYFIDCPNGVLTYQAYSGHSFLGGNVAIGGTTASEKLHVHGNLLATGAITMYYSSDKRLKQNIRKANASKTLMSLGGVYQYEYIASEVSKNSTYDGSHFGLIYQNVKGTALKSMCHEREDGFGTLNYLDTNFISLIAGATMEHCTEIEKLKKENKALRKRVEQLEKRIA